MTAPTETTLADLKNMRVGDVRGLPRYFNGQKYKNMLVEPVVFGAAYAVFGGQAVQVLNVIPKFEDAERMIPDFEPKSKVIEGGILSFRPRRGSEVTDGEKDKIINVVGRGFAREGDKDPEFSFNDASMAHELLYHMDDTVVIVIDYQFIDEKTGEQMVDIAGAMLFTGDLTIQKHENGKKPTLVNEQTLQAYNMVQLTILPQYNGRHLGVFAMKAIERIMKSYNADFVFWAGCAREFYNRCGSSNDPKMFGCPFKLCGNDQEDREIFFYTEIEYDGESKFQKNIVDVYQKDPLNCHFSIKYNENERLIGYYGLWENGDESDASATDVEQPSTVSTVAERLSTCDVTATADDTQQQSTKRPSGSDATATAGADIHQGHFSISEDAVCTINQIGGECVIMVQIEGKCDKKNWKLDFSEPHLSVSFKRIADEKTYRFKMSFTMDQPVTKESCRSVALSKSSKSSNSSKLTVTVKGNKVVDFKTMAVHSGP